MLVGAYSVGGGCLLTTHSFFVKEGDVAHPYGSYPFILLEPSQQFYSFKLKMDRIAPSPKELMIKVLKINDMRLPSLPTIQQLHFLTHPEEWLTYTNHFLSLAMFKNELKITLLSV